MPSNPFGAAYCALLDELTPALDSRTVRGWLHTRMTDDEVAAVIAAGIRPATLAAVRDRLDRRIAAGDLRQAEADTLFAVSPLQGDRTDARAGRFWLTSDPQEVDDGGVEPLLRQWGGESINFAHLEGLTADLLGRIGRGRVIEVAVPLAVTPDAFSAAKAVVATYAHERGAPANVSGFDFYLSKPLAAAAVLRVHAEGEDNYEQLGRTYPAN